MASSLFNQSNSPVFRQLIAPLEKVWHNAKNSYKCHVIPDDEWIETGIHRVLGKYTSGCEFLQQRVLRDVENLSKGNYFEALKSKRRCNFVQGLVDDFNMAQAQDALKNLPLFEGQDEINKALKDFHVYAGDGHFHAASSHDKRDAKGRKNAIGHLYALNLRNQHLSHMALGSDGESKSRKPHDMAVLKKMGKEALRQGAKSGQKVLYIWDRAGIDFAQWECWKNSAIYFVSRVKSNMVLEHPLPQDYDIDDGVNAGVLGNDLVSHSRGTMIRRVRFVVPETGEVMEFLTNLNNAVAPGVVAQLYFMRWRIEKSFHEVKNKLHETKAWGGKAAAKKAQAAFIVLAYNLAQLLHEKAGLDQAAESPADLLRDAESQRKRTVRLKAVKARVEQRGDRMPVLRLMSQRSTERSVKFYRWLESHLFHSTSWQAALGRLGVIFADF